MIRRPLVLALALALLPAAGVHAEDLLQTYELARTGDPQLAAAESGRLATKEGAVQARAALLPQVDGSASYRRTKSTGPSTQTQFDPVTGQPVRFTGDSESTSNNRNLSVNVSQVLFDFGTFSRVKSQNAISHAADFQLESAGDSLVTRTSQAYFNVLVAIESLAAAETQETALKKQFDFASKRLEVGLAPITDVHEARAQYDSARANTIVVRNVLEDAYQALVEITGQPIRNLKGLPADFQPTLPNERDADAWVAAAVDNNPALKAKQLQVQASEADVTTARAGHLPTLYFNGSYGKNATWGDSTFSSSNPPFSSTYPTGGESRGPAFGVTLSVPIFAGGATQSRVRQALAQRDVASDELEQQKRGLERATRNAYQTLVAGISEVEARRLALVSAQSAYDASQVGLEVGTRTVLDVLNNQQTLFRAQLDYAQARYNFLQNRLLLEQAAGTLDIEDVQDVNRLLTVNADAQLAPGDLAQ
ncbi:TolC family outer membrane protein [Luteimonas sp. 50]|uniref:Protein CyaE n=1 Tax=Cognatiluteimonas sedimenti TaxID=2927791 RepID=A0ABT0A3N1_9GAMM|nr:TolC family outer membrane protein [Lysobacter sedimenti]MCJ0825597.1 TolC family outer membrane protein [Lysobacter sedimenti]